MAATRLATETDNSTAPSRSDLCAAGSRTSARRRTPNTRASRLKGRLTRKTQRQLACTSRPPIGGPKAAAAPPTADHSPIAAPLRSGPKAGRSKPSEVGSIERAAGGLQDAGGDEDAERRRGRAQRPTTAVKMARPMRKARLRPVRSAQRPAGTRAAAKTIVYALRTHESELRLSPWKFFEMLGKAMLTMKRSREERNTPVSTISGGQDGVAALGRASAAAQSVLS